MQIFATVRIFCKNRTNLAFIMLTGKQFQNYLFLFDENVRSKLFLAFRLGEGINGKAWCKAI